MGALVMRGIVVHQTRERPMIAPNKKRNLLFFFISINNLFMIYFIFFCFFYWFRSHRNIAFDLVEPSFYWVSPAFTAFYLVLLGFT